MRFSTQMCNSGNEHVRRLHEEAEAEALKHKYIESMKQQRDLGDEARQDWYKKYWKIFVRRKLWRHLFGIEFWPEFSEEKFGLFQHPPVPQDTVYRFVMSAFYDGLESLMIVNMALETGLPCRTVRRILELIEMNDERVPCPAEIKIPN